MNENMEIFDNTIQVNESCCMSLKDASDAAGISVATNGGFGCASIDLVKLIEWIKANKPELLK